jgi:methionyl-tRNA formyltransferase
MKIVLFGITGLGNAVLEQLIKMNKKPKLVITRYERKMVDPYLKLENLGEFSKKNNIVVEYNKNFCSSYFDLCIVATYHKKINLKLSNFKKAFNIHPSYLPNHRGKDPIREVISKKEIYSGVSAHILTKEFDKGKIILQEEINIQDLKKKYQIMIRMYPIYKKFTKIIINNFYKL